MISRKYTQSKWVEVEFPDGTTLSSDALTGCLRTQDGKLSVWASGNSDEEKAEAVLAIATSGQHIESIDVLTLARSELAQMGYHLVESEEGGRSAVSELNRRHVDICDLSARRLLDFAEFLAPRLQSRATCRRYTRSEVLQLIHRALQGNRVSFNALSSSMQKDVRLKYPEEYP